MFHKNNRKDSVSKISSGACSPNVRDDSSEKSAIPPTAVVAPVILKSKKGNSPVEKRVTFKRKNDYTPESSCDVETSRKTPLLEKKKRKHISPLNKSPIKEVPDGKFACFFFFFFNCIFI